MNDFCNNYIGTLPSERKIAKLGDIRGLLPADVKMMAFTATVSRFTRYDNYSNLCLFFFNYKAQPDSQITKPTGLPDLSMY